MQPAASTEHGPEVTFQNAGDVWRVGLAEATTEFISTA
jgi:hypothetical protein